MEIIKQAFAAGQSIDAASKQIECLIRSKYSINVEVCITASSVGNNILQLAKDGIEIFRCSIPTDTEKMIVLEQKINAELVKQRNIEKLLN